MSDVVDRLTEALANRYRIERELGAGGMATVYLAEDVKHERKVAIKVLKPELTAVLGAERFVQEIKTTAALSHPHILPLFDSGEADGFLYYVMPYLQGETIRDKLNRETQFGIDEAVRLTMEVADALDHAHRHGVIHRDIKPENILLQDGRAMVMDFGIALAVSAAAGARMTETGLSLGTPHYMSPEQATADKDITHRTDIYSLASVLYEMLAGEPPHTGGSAQAIIMKIIVESVQPVTELRKSAPPHVTAALGKALEKLPADRFDSAKSFAEALANPAFTTATSTAAVGAGRRPARRPTPLTGVLAAATLLATALAAWGWLRPNPPPVVIRNRVAIPENQALQLGYLVPQFAFAPDGSWLVYTGPNAIDRTQLWVKARDRAEAVPLAGTEGGFSPAVSPDGQWIAFGVGSQLRRVPSGGGAPTTISDSHAQNAPSLWLDENTIFYMDDEGGLRLMPAAGGATEVVYREPSNRAPFPVSALPDGRGVLLINCSASCQPTSDLWVVDLQSGETTELLPDVAWAAYLEGRLLFTRRNGAMFGVRFDLESLAMEGPPVPLFDGVAVSLQGHVALAASGSIAYLAGPPSRGIFGTTFEAMWITRDGQEVPVDPTWSFQLSANPGWTLSPDGARLAISLHNAGNDDVWVKDLNGGPLSRLTFSEGSDYRPRWTPDGRSVTFISSRASSENPDLYVRRADGSGSDSLLLDLEAPISEAATSQDGQWLVLRVGGFVGQTNQRDIVTVRVGQDTVPRPLLTASYDEAVPALSPDGRWIAYESGETERREIFVRPFPDVEAGKWQISTSGGVSPVWAHSGRELFFINGNRELVSQAVLPGSSFQRGEQVVLFTIDPSYRLGPNYTPLDVSPDDQRFVLVRQKGEDADAAPVLIVVENWMEEVKQAMEGR